MGGAGVTNSHHAKPPARTPGEEAAVGSGWKWRAVGVPTPLVPTRGRLGPSSLAVLEFHALWARATPSLPPRLSQGHPREGSPYSGPQDWWPRGASTVPLQMLGPTVPQGSGPVS